DVLATLWARTTIDDLSSAVLKAENAEGQEKLNKQITDLGLGYGLMTQFTSFVAVEDRVVNQGGTPVKIEVPVQPPAGTTGAGNGDGDGDSAMVADTAKPRNVKPRRRSKNYKRWTGR